MKPIATIFFLTLGLGLLGAAIWLGNQAAPPADTSGKKTPPPHKVLSPAKGPKIAPTGPYPKAVSPEPEFNFGTMQHLTENSHDYVIRNEGEAPLELSVGEITCNCTGAELATEAPIPPGEATTVRLSWKIKSPNPSFRHSAKILTNDPENSELELVVTGTVETGLQFDPPGGMWDLGDAGDKSVLESYKAVYSSSVDSFNITQLVPGTPRITCVAEPLGAEAIANFKAKCGYLLKLSVDVDDISGSLDERVTLKTDLANAETIDLYVKVRKQGPIELISRSWNAERGRLHFGEFLAQDGKEVEVSVLTRVAEEVNLLSADCPNQNIKVAWEKDEKFRGKSNMIHRYRLKIQVPPGLAPALRRGDEAEKLELKFDHPRIGVFKIMVDYLST